LCVNLCIFEVPNKINKGHLPMTHGAYGTPRTSGAPGTLGTN